MIKAVLFDMDGVLIDTEKYLTQFWQQAAAEAGLSFDDGRLLSISKFCK